MSGRQACEQPARYDVLKFRDLPRAYEVPFLRCEQMIEPRESDSEEHNRNQVQENSGYFLKMIAEFFIPVIPALSGLFF